VNLIVIDKQPQLQWLTIDEAIEHCARGASIWRWASNDGGATPDVVLAAAGDIPTLEIVAAAWWLRHHAPELKVRVVNVVDLMTLFPSDVHPHGMQGAAFDDVFTRDAHVVLRLPRLSARDPRDHPRPPESGAIPRPRASTRKAPPRPRSTWWSATA
jgi:xylulose-5-phosphate/fructose-6-phosphate phosphoketolase